jgi:formyltetrahydrofolate deformylase
MRVSFTEDSFMLCQSDLVREFASIAETFQMQWSIHYSQRPKRAAILVSKFDHCLTDLLWRWNSGELAMEIPCIISNHPDLEPIAQRYHIPYYHFPIRKEHRKDDHMHMLDFLSGKVDFLVLARYITEKLDDGPIIAQDVIHCNHRDTLGDMVRKGRDVERRVLAEAVRLHTEDRVLVYRNKTIVF